MTIEQNAPNTAGIRPEMSIETWDIDRLKPYNNNPRINKLAVDQVAQSLKEYGWKQPIVVDTDGVIIVGHTRLYAAQSLKYKTVPVSVAADLTEQQAKAYRIADNKTNEYALWDIDLLKIELEESGDLYTGFTDEDMLEMFGPDEDPDCDPDDVPDLPDEDAVVSQLGDVWICGNHKVVCGSSTEPEAYELLLEDEVVDMIWTDPPYNVDYESPAKRAIREGGKQVMSFGGAKGKYKGASSAELKKGTDEIQNDNMTTEAFEQFLNDAFKQAATVTKKGGCIYVAFSEKEGMAFRRALNNHFLYKQTIAWVKNQHVFGRQDYNHKYEPIMYGWKEGAGHYWSGDFTQTTVLDARDDLKKMKKEELLEMLEMIADSCDVIDVDKPSRSDMHPTMKPVALIEKQITSSCMYNEVVLDMFGGSGSTMIAAQLHKRKARLIELSPKYVDVIVNRWQTFAKDTAINKQTGKSFSEMSVERLGE